VAAASVCGAWLATWLARRWNRRGAGTGCYAALAGGALLGLAGAGALLAAPWAAGMDPTTHVYPAIVWVLALWAAVHVLLGVVMHGYCIARRVAGRLTPEHDTDAWTVTLYWHFTGVTVLVTVGVTALFPLVA
jgi:cytochrome c oxidase subunit I+III